NPENWWPIEQDYYTDGFAFTTGAPRPIRIHLKSGRVVMPEEMASSNNRGKMIDGGAATVLDMLLDKNKTLKELKLQAIANDVVIGLMSVTLLRPRKIYMFCYFKGNGDGLHLAYSRDG